MSLILCAVSVSTIMASVNSLVNGLATIKEELRILRRIRISPPSDSFIATMEVRPPSFVPRTTTELRTDIRGTSDAGYRSVATDGREIGCGSESARAVLWRGGRNETGGSLWDYRQVFFGVTRTSSLHLFVAAGADGAIQRAEIEVRAADKKSNSATTNSKRSSDVRISPHYTSPPLTTQQSVDAASKSIGRGGLDNAIRDLRSGNGLRRTRVVAQRPLSRVFLDGSNR